MISVIIPVYKVEPYLRQCLDSLKNQTYRDLEILLIDDGSPDHCGEICEAYAQDDARFRVFHTENHGLSAARNLGLIQSKGEILSFVDSDDYIEIDMFEEMMKALEGSGADICICSFWVESPTEKKIRRCREGKITREKALESLLDEQINNNVWNKLYRRELFDKVVFPDGTNYEDIATLHRILDKSESIIGITDAYYHYRVRAESITKTYTAKNLLDYANVHIERFRYYQSECPAIAMKKEAELLGLAAKGISKVWRWWYVCNREEKKKYKNEIEELKSFARSHFPLLGCSSWSPALRCVAPFMRSNSAMTLAILYYLNQLYRRLSPEKCNLVE